MATTYGIDVSKHQGKIDWTKVKSSGKVQFAILRAGYGREISQKDPTFDTNYAGSKAAGIPVGAYWYSYAKTADDARKEAATCLQAIKGKHFEFPIYFDIEEKEVLALGKTKCTAIAQAFLETVEKAGYWVGIYSSKSHLESNFTKTLLERYAVWVAHYGVSRTTYTGQYGIWQKSDSGSVYGISGHVDIDECYVDYPAQIKAAGLNGHSKSTADQKPVQAPLQTPAARIRTYTVKKGDTLSGIAKRYNTTVAKLAAANNIANPNRIYVGQKIKIS